MNKKNNQLGFTLIEIIISLFIFSIVLLSVISIFQLVISGQRSAVASQNIQDSMRYLFEIMSKEVRNAQQDSSCSGHPVTNDVYNTNITNDILYFKNKNSECVLYYLSNGRLMVNRDGNVAAVTPAQLKVNNLKFYIIDNPFGAAVSIQPRVTIKMDTEVVGKELHKQSMFMQTTISSRKY